MINGEITTKASINKTRISRIFAPQTRELRLSRAMMCFISSYLGDDGVWWGPEPLPAKTWALFMITPHCPGQKTCPVSRTQGMFRQWVRAENTHTASASWRPSSSGGYRAKMLALEGASEWHCSLYGASLSIILVILFPAWVAVSHCFDFLLISCGFSHWNVTSWDHEPYPTCSWLYPWHCCIEGAL